MWINFWIIFIKLNFFLNQFKIKYELIFKYFLLNLINN